jgi:heme oxygenase
MHEKCDLKYNLKHVEITEENCKDIIKETKKYFKDNYIITDTLDEKRDKCINEFLVSKFSTGTFYNVENDFKSEINIDFSLDFYKDI